MCVICQDLETYPADLTWNEAAEADLRGLDTCPDHLTEADRLNEEVNRG